MLSLRLPDKVATGLQARKRHKDIELIFGFSIEVFNVKLYNVRPFIVGDFGMILPMRCQTSWTWAHAMVGVNLERQS